MRKLLFLFLLLLLPFNAFGAVAFDSVSASLQSGASPLTFAFNNVAGNFVAVILDPDTDGCSVTYNGQAMTSAGASEANSGRFTQLFYLESAPTGNNNVVVSSCGSDIYARAISFSGAAASGAVSGYNKAGASSLTPSLAVTTTVDGSMVLAGGQVGAVATAGLNTTQPSSGANPQLAGFWYSTNPVSPAGSFTINILSSGGGAYGIAGFAISPPFSVVRNNGGDDDWWGWFLSFF